MKLTCLWSVLDNFKPCDWSMWLSLVILHSCLGSLWSELGCSLITCGFVQNMPPISLSVYKCTEAGINSFVNVPRLSKTKAAVDKCFVCLFHWVEGWYLLLAVCLFERYWHVYIDSWWFSFLIFTVVYTNTVHYQRDNFDQWEAIYEENSPLRKLTRVI